MHRRLSQIAAAAALIGMLVGTATMAHAGSAESRRGANKASHARSTTLHGEVLSVAAGGFQLAVVHTMPVTVTVGISTTITVAAMSGAASDIQSGRYVDVVGRYEQAQQAFVATRVNVVVPAISGRVTAANGDTFTLVSARGITYQVTTTTTTQFVSRKAGKHQGGSKAGGAAATVPADGAPVTIAVGDRVTVQAFPPAGGTGTLTALRIYVASAAATGTTAVPISPAA